MYDIITATTCNVTVLPVGSVAPQDAATQRVSLDAAVAVMDTRMSAYNSNTITSYTASAARMTSTHEDGTRDWSMTAGVSSGDMYVMRFNGANISIYEGDTVSWDVGTDATHLFVCDGRYELNTAPESIPMPVLPPLITPTGTLHVALATATFHGQAGLTYGTGRISSGLVTRFVPRVTLRFMQPGLYPCFDALHPQMRTVIRVLTPPPTRLAAGAREYRTHSGYGNNNERPTWGM